MKLNQAGKDMVEKRVADAFHETLFTPRGAAEILKAFPHRPRNIFNRTRVRHLQFWGRCQRVKKIFGTRNKEVISDDDYGRNGSEPWT